MSYREVLSSRWEQTVDELGVPALLSSTKNLWADKQTIIGIKTAGFGEDEIVNAYGVGTRIITIKGSDFIATKGPQKYDTVTLVHGEKLSLAAVFPIDLRGARLGYKAYVSGDVDQ